MKLDWRQAVPDKIFRLKVSIETKIYKVAFVNAYKYSITLFHFKVRLIISDNKFQNPTQNKIEVFQMCSVWIPIMHVMFYMSTLNFRPAFLQSGSRQITSEITSASFQKLQAVQRPVYLRDPCTCLWSLCVSLTLYVHPIRTCVSDLNMSLTP